MCRSFTGAWIEMLPTSSRTLMDTVAPHGSGLKSNNAVLLQQFNDPTPSRERGLKIIRTFHHCGIITLSLLTGERGLK